MKMIPVFPVRVQTNSYEQRNASGFCQPDFPCPEERLPGSRIQLHLGTASLGIQHLNRSRGVIFFFFNLKISPNPRLRSVSLMGRGNEKGLSKWPESRCSRGARDPELPGEARPGAGPGTGAAQTARGGGKAGGRLRVVPDP